MKEAITYQDLRLSLCEIESIENLYIVEGVNAHGRMSLTAILKDKMKEEVIHEMGEDVALYSVRKDGVEPIFKGRMTGIDLVSEGGLYQLKVEAYSYTYDMDIQKKSRSFQDINMGSHGVIKSVMEGYPNKDSLLFIKNEPIGELVVQYNETDWEFVKRFASKYQQGIYPVDTFDGIRFYAGIPEKKERTHWEDRPYKVYKDLEEYNLLKKNGLSGLIDSEFVTYQIGGYEPYTIGAQVTFQGQGHIIFRVERRLEDGLLWNVYSMRKKNGLKQRRTYNDRVTGVSVDGQVLEVKRDKIRCALSIDGGQEKGKAYWFPFSTVAASQGGNGWFSMPKKGDQVRAYFPVADESQGYVITKAAPYQPAAPALQAAPAAQPAGGVAGGASQGNTGGGKAPSPAPTDPMADPAIKNLTTPRGEVISFSGEGVKILVSGGKGAIFLNMDGSISLTGMGDISLGAAEEIILRAEKEITLSGTLHVDLLSDKSAHVELLPEGIINFSAKEIFEN